MAKLYILCGLPFSGKSSLAGELSEKSNVKVVSFDNITNTLRRQDPSVSYEEILGTCYAQIQELLHANHIVVYDSTNLGEEKREKLVALAKKEGATAAVVYMPITMEEIKKRMLANEIHIKHHDIDDYDFGAALDKMSVPERAIVVANNEDKKSFCNTFV